MSLRDQAAIVGVGQLPFSKDIGRSEETTALEASKLALEDAGLRPADVDGMVKWSIQTTAENAIARNLGVPNLRFFGEVGYGGGGGCGIVGHAAAAIAAGMARCVLVYRSRNRGSGGRPWAGTSRERDQSTSDANETAFYAPYGFVRPADQVAMFARRFLHERAYTTEHLGWIAVACRRHASVNPMAMMREPITVADHARSRFISEPLRLLDCCLETDGAAAVVVAHKDLARDLRQKPAWITAASQGMGPRNWIMNNFFKDPFLESPGAYAARDLWRMAGVSPRDVDVAQLYDAFTPLVLASLEEYGFCKPGEAGAFVEDHGLEVGGRLPTNTSGGSLSEAYVHGINLIIEATRQIRGTSVNQVPGARLSLATSGNMVPTGALLLRGD
ncbi:MAG TPA: lipid-transfer protein [Candidatus Binatia bacterium]|nr:lipid-transfer protein [Candidatus Binatia bacterium]